jgi:hypothetical protein
MRTLSVAVLFAAVVTSGCVRQSGSPVGDDGARGRYAGVGTYQAGPLWRRIVAPDSKDAAAAKLQDDDQIIVVVDSRTGEVRQCGNLSGYCIGMNPWAAATPAPAKLSIHADQLDAQEAAAAKASPAQR